MPDEIPSYARLIEQFTDWARREENIRAAVIIGSRARTDHPADQWSDLDLLIAAKDPKPLLESTDWLRNIGVPWIAYVEPAPDEGYEHRVLFEGGLDVDFAPMSAEDLRHMAEHPLTPVMADILRRGVKIILDKDGLAGTLPEQAGPVSPEPPPEAEFLSLVNDFWYHTVWTAKRLRRGELWRAVSCCNSNLKDRLRQMLEWHARATRGRGVDTWMRGRFLEEWADPKAAAALPQVFAHYDEEDVWRALRATMDVFHTLAKETAVSLSYPYPAEGEEHARGLVGKMHSNRRAHDPR